MMEPPLPRLALGFVSRLLFIGAGVWVRRLPVRLPFIVALLALGGASCSTTRALRPVGEKKFQVGGSLGGPLFTNLGAAIPAPLFNVYGRYGLTDRLTLEAGLNPTVVRPSASTRAPPTNC